MGLLRDAMRTDRFQIMSPYDVDTVVQRAHDVGASGMGSYLKFGTEPVRGRASRRQIVMVKRTLWNNSFRPYLFAEPDGSTAGSSSGPTLLRCELRPQRAVVWLMAVWWSICVIVALGWLAAGQGSGRFLALMLPVFGVGVVWISTWISRDERDLLRRTIVGVAGAQPTPTDSADLP